LVFNAEQPASATLSQQVALPPSPAGGPPAISVTVIFAAAPGAFEFDVMESDTDIAANFIPAPVGWQINSLSSGTNEARSDLAPFMGIFAAVLCKTQNANNAVVSVRITRRA
jgi:hypothetical protein